MINSNVLALLDSEVHAHTHARTHARTHLLLLSVVSSRAESLPLPEEEL